MTAVLMDGRVAAVDMGCIYKGDYKLLAGGTHSDYPGVAKAINLYHMQEACNNKYKTVDFLCGDFAWKKLFHLTPRPLYEVSNIGA
jgi:CelD/BcsL family acetyltransferase involved in cellulose biosynthesis